MSKRLHCDGMPFKKGHRRYGGLAKGQQRPLTTEVRAIARAILDDPEYRASVRERMRAGTAPHLETLLWHYAHGRPVERREVEIGGTLAELIVQVTDDSTD